MILLVHLRARGELAGRGARAQGASPLRRLHDVSGGFHVLDAVGLTDAQKDVLRGLIGPKLKTKGKFVDP